MEVNWYKRAAAQQELEHGNVEVAWDGGIGMFTGNGNLKTDRASRKGFYDFGINPVNGNVEASVWTDSLYHTVKMEIQLPWETVTIDMPRSGETGSGRRMYDGTSKTSSMDRTEMNDILNTARPWPEIRITGYEYDPNEPVAPETFPAVELRTRRKRWK